MSLFSKSRSVFILPKSQKQPLIQTLEPRRLMSLTAAPDFAPATEAPTHFSHSFGFENLLPSPPAVEGARFDAAIGKGPRDFGLSNLNGSDLVAIESQLTQAIATGKPFSFAPGNSAMSAGAVDTSVVTPTNPTTLSELYTALHNSTVSEIDNASANELDALKAVATAAPSVANVVSDASQNVSQIAQPSALASAGTDARLVSIAATKSIEAAGAQVVTPVAQVVTVPATLSGSQLKTAASEIDSVAGPHTGIHSIEAELLSVSTFAREVTSEIGRDLAIGIAHLESDAVSISENMSVYFEGWRSAAALTVAAAATGVYLHSQAKNDRGKQASFFSSQLIETVG